MAIGVRDITNLEELLEVQDDDKIIVIQNGEAKLISKVNAKFGGGSVTTFYVDAADSGNVKRLVDADGNPISAQAAYDAVMSGPVYIVVKVEGNDYDVFLVPFSFSHMKTDVAIVSVVFLCMNISKIVRFYAGENPSGGVS